METKPKWQTIPPAIFLPANLATDSPSFLQQIPTQSYSTSTSSIDSHDTDRLGDAIDALFEEVNADLQARNQDPADDPAVIDLTLAADPPPDYDPIPPDIAQEPNQDDQTLQNEIDDILRTVEEERHQQTEPPPSPDRRHMMMESKREMIAYHSNALYKRQDLSAVVNRARRNPNFRGLAALEVYAATAQHLSESNYRAWMADGLGYFNLGPRHPQ